jgi:hypothetical protein
MERELGKRMFYGKANELYNVFEASFATLTDEAVVSKLNGQLGNKGWTSAKASLSYFKVRNLFRESKSLMRWSNVWKH